MKLVPVSDEHKAASALYRLMAERTPDESISHRSMPSWDAHLEFIASCPYNAWYLLKVHEDFVGSVYLTHQDEIGVFVFEEHRHCGYGSRAVAALMAQHPRTRYLANINPANKRSKALFNKLGFRHIQETYELIA
jgi:RimJ/RimL family protein N-acetyltransferase